MQGTYERLQDTEWKQKFRTSSNPEHMSTFMNEIDKG